jgi:hypothetical protein
MESHSLLDWRVTTTPDAKMLPLIPMASSRRRDFLLEQCGMGLTKWAAKAALSRPGSAKLSAEL